MDFATSRRTVALWLRNAWVPIILVVVAFVSGGIITANHSDQFSPLDEWVYYDYTVKIPTQGVVRQGELIGHEALVGMACNGDSFGPRGEPCNDVQDINASYPQGGKTSADIYTPLYFAITWSLGKVIQFLTGAEFLTAARATGILWLAGGLLVFYRLLELMKVRRVVTLGLGLAIIGAPTTFWANTYISTDAPVFLVGAALLLAGVSAIKGRSSPWWLLPIAVIGILLKVTTVLALGLVVLALVFFVIFANHETAWVAKRRLLIPVVVTVAAAGFAQVAWLLIRAQISLGAGPDQGLAQPLAWRDIAGMLALFIYPGPLSGNYDPLLRIPQIVGAPLVLITIAGIVAFACARFANPLEKSLAFSIVLASTLFAPLLALGMYLLLGDVFPVIERYAIPLLPAYLLAAAMIIKNRVAEWAVLGYGAFLVVFVTACSIAFA